MKFIIFLPLFLTLVELIPGSSTTECKSKVEKANCKMVEGQCWCFHEGGISGSSVCGYPDGYSGEYFSIATDSKPSPHTIINAFGKTPNPQHCNLDTKTGCDSDSLSNVCIALYGKTQCHGTYFGSQYTNKQRWERANAALAGGFVRCKDIEDAIQMCSDEVQNQDETGVDCGGSCKACPTCKDGIQNQDETGTDCGGSCAPCATCKDEIQNQDETGIDCGGSCGACAVTAEQCQKFIEEACPKENEETGCLEENARYMGANISKKSKKKNVPSAENCQQKCQKNPECMFFVWNSDKNQCILKKAKGSVRKNCGKQCTGKVSGPKNC